MDHAVQQPGKVVGSRNRRAEDRTPAAYLRRAAALQAQCDRIHPYPRPRGFVFKAKSWEDYRRWRSAQDNPRLW